MGMDAATAKRFGLKKVIDGTYIDQHGETWLTCAQCKFPVPRSNVRYGALGNAYCPECTVVYDEPKKTSKRDLSLGMLNK